MNSLINFSKHPVKSYQQAADITTHDYLTIAPVPHDEKCTQVGECPEDGLFECSVFIDQLIRKYGPPPEGYSFFIMKNTHYLGIYYEAAISYKMDKDKAIKYAEAVEFGCDKWDNISLGQLRTARHHLHQQYNQYFSKCA